MLQALKSMRLFTSEMASSAGPSSHCEAGDLDQQKEEPGKPLGGGLISTSPVY
jgi:hypothetical protein